MIAVKIWLAKTGDRLSSWQFHINTDLSKCDPSSSRERFFSHKYHRKSFLCIGITEGTCGRNVSSPIRTMSIYCYHLVGENRELIGISARPGVWFHVDTDLPRRRFRCLCSFIHLVLENIIFEHTLRCPVSFPNKSAVWSRRDHRSAQPGATVFVVFRLLVERQKAYSTVHNFLKVRTYVHSTGHTPSKLETLLVRHGGRLDDLSGQHEILVRLY